MRLIFTIFTTFLEKILKKLVRHRWFKFLEDLIQQILTKKLVIKPLYKNSQLIQSCFISRSMKKTY